MLQEKSLSDIQFNLLHKTGGCRILSSDLLAKEEASLDNDKKILLYAWLKDNGVLLERRSIEKEALYHCEKGRKYRPTKHEIEKKEFLCPSCKVVLVKKVYKLRTPLLTCPECRWSIRRNDIFEPQSESEPIVRKPGEA